MNRISKLASSSTLLRSCSWRATPSSLYAVRNSLFTPMPHVSSLQQLQRYYSSEVNKPSTPNNNNNNTESTSGTNNNNNSTNNESSSNNNQDQEVKKSPGEHHTQKRQITWASFIVAILCGGVGWLYYDHLMVQKREKIRQIETYGTSSIGGAWSLFDENGKPVSDLDFRGKYLLLYFGFTFCPDACPAELDKMTRVLNNLQQYNLLDSVVPIFITIDPWRDTVEQIKNYIVEFHPKVRGFTGTPEQITKLAKSYRVFITKSGKGDSYLVDHSIIEYLIGPDGKFIEFYGSNLTSDQMTMKIVERMANKGKGGANRGEIQREKSTFDKIISVFTRE
ncbi:hypothetical protein SAMD00019534_015190 [Acytostelium subglobosum LB1]|uniref:hypothetical protein n=1 Tax=Acytostelium subglobosum LB1 TaxID=1410327 RepID=UPI000644C341|nr:hypothetical protein SAMD00019534_015190 [Acytostelium subglobosum LB1]GAM18344.1 hypothetical protein SAMD00019534_015190 [Acytostelium subglobosum LB1]|eukprot:XP_012757564.1 hypothetical protein SAMD00019534_015190 [Acytostelium subglobosum LB1]